MDARLQKRVQRYGWDRSASSYEDSWRWQLRPAQELLLRMAAPRPGETVLDIACGTGLVTLPAAAAVGPEGMVLATDISDVMVERCQRAARAAGHSNVRAERMEAENLRYEDSAFDVVLCALGLMYVTDFAGSVREMFRVTRRGGRAVSAVWGQRDCCGWAGIFEIVDARVHTEVCPMFFHLGTGHVQESLFEQAGFTDVRTERIRTVLDYDSAEAACHAAFAGGPVAMAYARFDEATRREAHDAYIASIAAFATNGGYAIPGEFVVTRGEQTAP